MKYRSFYWTPTVVIALSFLESSHVLGDSKSIPGLAIARYALPSLSMTQDEPTNSTGTAVGNKVLELKKELQALKTRTASRTESTRALYDRMITEVSQYHIALAEIEAKLQLGTTPSNPKLIALRNAAFQDLEHAAGTLTEMNGLAAGFAQDFQQSKSLIARIEAAFRIPGAVDEDHAHLILLSGEIANLDGTINRVLTILDGNREQQGRWLVAEKSRFAAYSIAVETGKIGTALYSSVELPKIAPLPIMPMRPTKIAASVPEPMSHKHLPRKYKNDGRKSKLGQQAENNSNDSLKPLPLSKSGVSPIESTSIPTASQGLPSRNRGQALKGEGYITVKKRGGGTTTFAQPEPHVLPVSSPVSPVSPPAPLHGEVTPLLAPLTPPAPQASIKEAPKPLPAVVVDARPKIQPLAEEAVSNKGQEKQQRASAPSPLTLISSAEISKKRAPLCTLDPSQEPSSQKWFLMSSAKRGLKTASGVIEIVTIIGAGEKMPSARGEAVKSLLLSMGLKSEQIKSSYAKSETEASGKIYIFGM